MAQDRKEGPFEQIGEAVGGALGKAAGRANDMAMNVAGTVFTSALQALGGWWSTPEAEQASRSFSESEDRACRQHYESRRSASTAQATEYDRVRPAYQFGYMAGRNPEYQSKPFDQVEAQIERAWEQVGREQSGSWSDVRDQVSFGYTYRTPGAPNPT